VELGGWRLLQPSFFGPNRIGFFDEDNICQLNVDVASPRADWATRLYVEFRSSGLIKTYPDGAQLFACQFDGPVRLQQHSATKVRRLEDGDFAALLFHHTDIAARGKILANCELWSSSWNLAGTRTLENVGYGYFTTLPKIERKHDLERIAMSAAEELHFRTTNANRPEETLTLRVRRGNTADRTSRVEVWIPSKLVSAPHLNFHALPREAYYEIVGPEIFRVGLQPGQSLYWEDGLALHDPATVKAFTYVVVGNTSTLEGLAAPYNEEEIRSVFHLEGLGNDLDILEFWKANSNQDLVEGRQFEAKIVCPM
jgi:hypothetical protein